MRNDIGFPGAGLLSYEIRAIMRAGEEFARLGVPMIWENIGDPIAKGENMPAWMKDIIAGVFAHEREAIAYVPTKGLLSAREFVAKKARDTGAELSPDDVMFFNGVGDAIGKVYAYLHPSARIVGPSPSYPAHSSAESARAGAPHPTYDLDPEKGWAPDIDGLRKVLAERKDVAGILIVNPGNPTGRVIPRRTLEEMADIAREYSVFIISDEIYGRIAFGAEPWVSMAEVAPDVPMLVMRGISKEFPWPGGRCGWVEVYNKKNDRAFAEYVRTVLDAKTLEVCAGSLPQAVLPVVMNDPRYEPHLAERRSAYARKADIVERVFQSVPGILAPKPDGSFYISVVFQDDMSGGRKSLPIDDVKVREYAERLVLGTEGDKRFVYYLMAHAGVCVVPLSGMHSHRHGFRMTLLEPDEKKFEATAHRIADALTKYLAS